MRRQRNSVRANPVARK